jgi:hypothetical protein
VVPIRDHFRVLQKKQVGEGCTKVGTIKIGVLTCTWIVELLASGAVYGDGVVARQIGETNRKAGLPVTVYTRASTKIGILKFFVLINKRR